MKLLKVNPLFCKKSGELGTRHWPGGYSQLRKESGAVRKKRRRRELSIRWLRTPDVEKGLVEGLLNEKEESKSIKLKTKEKNIRKKKEINKNELILENSNKNKYSLQKERKGGIEILSETQKGNKNRNVKGVRDNPLTKRRLRVPV